MYSLGNKALTTRRIKKKNYLYCEYYRTKGYYYVPTIYLLLW